MVEFVLTTSEVCTIFPKLHVYKHVMWLIRIIQFIRLLGVIHVNASLGFSARVVLVLR